MKYQNIYGLFQEQSVQSQYKNYFLETKFSRETEGVVSLRSFDLRIRVTPSADLILPQPPPICKILAGPGNKETIVIDMMPSLLSVECLLHSVSWLTEKLPLSKENMQRKWN